MQACPKPFTCQFQTLQILSSWALWLVIYLFCAPNCLCNKTVFFTCLGWLFPLLALNLPVVNYTYLTMYGHVYLFNGVSSEEQSITKVTPLNTCPPGTSAGANNDDVICKCLVYNVAVCIHSLYFFQYDYLTFYTNHFNCLKSLCMCVCVCVFCMYLALQIWQLFPQYVIPVML